VNAIIKRYGTVLRCYQMRGQAQGEYTIIPPRWARKEYGPRGCQNDWAAIGCNAYPFHPQGIGMYCGAMPGPHLGKRVCWSDLPADVQKFARQSFPEYAP
jgi:hypothetical protein